MISLSSHTTTIIHSFPSFLEYVKKKLKTKYKISSINVNLYNYRNNFIFFLNFAWPKVGELVGLNMVIFILYKRWCSAVSLICTILSPIPYFIHFWDLWCEIYFTQIPSHLSFTLFLTRWLLPLFTLNGQQKMSVNLFTL